MAKEAPYREMDSRGFGYSNPVYEERLEVAMITYCDVNTCEDCPRYGDDCDGDKRVEHTDLISRADVFEIIDKAFSQPMRNGVTLYADICLMLNALPTHDTSLSTHERHLISKADAIAYPLSWEH